VTALCFDLTGRRVVVGKSSGAVAIFNFSNGQMLNNLTSTASREIAAVIAADSDVGGGGCG
jgi:hypothetical protein